MVLRGVFRSSIDSFTSRIIAASNHYTIPSITHLACDEGIYSFIESVGISRKKSVYPLSIDNLCPSSFVFRVLAEKRSITSHNPH